MKIKGLLKIISFFDDFLSQEKKRNWISWLLRSVTKQRKSREIGSIKGSMMSGFCDQDQTPLPLISPLAASPQGKCSTNSIECTGCLKNN